MKPNPDLHIRDTENNDNSQFFQGIAIVLGLVLIVIILQVIG